MNRKEQRRIVAHLLQCWPRTWAGEAGVKLRNTPALLYQLLVAATLFSARIGAAQASEAMRALLREGLTTPRKLCDAGWERRVHILNRNGYARYDESTSRMLGDAAQRLMKQYRGDLRRLRDEAACEPERELALLQQFKGIGKVGAAIFLREAQGVWTEAYPFIDERGRRGAQQLGLPTTAKALANLVDGPEEMVVLVSGLVRVSLMAARERKQLVDALGAR